MKNKYSIIAVIAAGVFTLCSSTAYAQYPKSTKKAPSLTTVKKLSTPVPSFADGAIKMPQNEKGYLWNDGEWQLDTERKYSYDNIGNMLSCQKIFFTNTGVFTNATMKAFEYNDNRMVVTETNSYSVDSVEWFNDTRVKYEYDEICIDMPIVKGFYFWNYDTDEWIFDEKNKYNYFLELNRDEMNRVTSYTKWDTRNKNFIDTDNVITYGDNGHAENMVVSAEDNGKAVPLMELDSLKWYKTNDQFSMLDDYNIQNPFDNDKYNIPEELTFYVYDSGEKFLLMKSKWEYDDNGRLLNGFFEDEYSICGVTRTYTDEFGSYEECSADIYDNNEDGIYTTDEMEITSKVVVTFNEKGDVVRVDSYEPDYDTYELFLAGSEKYDYVYDEDGYKTEMIFSESYGPDEEFEPAEKYVYSDFVSPTATNIEKTSNATPNVYIRGNNIVFENAIGKMFYITDVHGRIYKRGVITDSEISMNSLPKGMYIVNINGGGNAVKMIKR